MKAVYALVLALLAAPAFAEVSVQPVATTAPATTRPAPVHQLTTVISTAVRQIEHMPPSSDHDAKVAAIVAGLKGQRVYGSVIVDLASEGFVNAHLAWHDQQKLTEREQQLLAKDQGDIDKAEAENNEWNSRSAPNSTNNETLAVIALAKKRLGQDTEKVNAAAIARLPEQTIAITTDDPKAEKLLPQSNYVVRGYITAATESVDAAGFVSFAVKIAPAP